MADGRTVLCKAGLIALSGRSASVRPQAIETRSGRMRRL